ncbi:TonB-dependent hemoglobin/transferrin/lactoferrin family receptor [Pelistega ratti]|uniref:TonB-dependent hemoglobin/transferrin/lactoferrin family receptor n=1 Tax=Pelistega ratti TaxID=2652177 RepID=UPI0013587F40|nr:TonB-dependent hemoglobin/transferrin/lactoferrin family receptor [Pelistega ratti]
MKNNRQQGTSYNLLPIVIILLNMANIATAEETLDEIQVQDELNSIRQTQSSVIHKNAETIQKELIRDTRDLVRYTSDVGISDNGRFLKGFSIRGVEGNRVGISIDGVNLPDSEENSLYARYGNFNSSRLSIDSELVREIDIVRGSDSFNSGSGALGGVVNYRTLEAIDIVKPGNKFGALLRGGYASKNSEWVRTIGLGYVGDQFDALFMYSQRTGHEMKSNGEGDLYSGSQSQHPDPSTHRYHSYLAKLGYQINPHHRMGILVNGQRGNRYTDERSYVLYGGAWREADDQNKRYNLNFNYTYAPESKWLSYARLDLDYQKTDLATISYKGGTHWSTKAKELNEILDRRMKTTFKRASIEAESVPFDLWGEHTLAFRSYISDREFKNINHDTIGIGSYYQKDYRYTIQRPVKTKMYGFSLKDHIVWNNVFSSDIGIRYDYAKLTPKALNAECSKACLEGDTPNKSSFANWSGFVGINAQVSNAWKLGYQLSTGYRIPTASEMYFTFTNPYGSWRANPDLKSERSISHTLFAQAHSDVGLFDINLYQSRYRHFLFEQESVITSYSYGRKYQGLEQQMVNIDKAKVSGIEIKTYLNLNQIASFIPKGFNFYGSLGYSKGKLSNGTSLLSIQPLKMVFGLDFEDPDGKWGIFSRFTYLGAKKPKDAKTIQNNRYCVREEFDYWYGNFQCIEHDFKQEIVSYKHLNKSALITDIFGYYHPTDSITLRAGVYNLFNQKYHTWDALRGINAHSTTNTVDKKGYGLQRFYAPGRNFAASVEIRF